MGFLEVHEVTVRFGGVVALDGVSIDVKKGTTVGVIGPNGSGKTTLFNVISGLQPMDAGKVFFDGGDISGLDVNERASAGIARTFQNLGLMMQETVLTNVLAGQHLEAGYTLLDALLRPGRRRARERALQERGAQLLHRVGLGAHTGTVVADLSFAGARLVELAAVLARRSRILLLDEPTTGLDSAERNTLAQMLAELRAAGETVVLIAHDVGFVMRLCDKVYVLAQGKLLREGEPAAIQRDPAVISAYLGGSHAAHA